MVYRKQLEEMLAKNPESKVQLIFNQDLRHGKSFLKPLKIYDFEKYGRKIDQNYRLINTAQS